MRSKSKVVWKRATCQCWVGRNEQTQLCGYWTKVHRIFLLNAEEIIVDNASYRLSISLSVPHIFALKLGSCPK